MRTAALRGGGGCEAGQQEAAGPRQYRDRVQHPTEPAAPTPAHGVRSLQPHGIPCHSIRTVSTMP